MADDARASESDLEGFSDDLISDSEEGEPSCPTNSGIDSDPCLAPLAATSSASSAGAPCQKPDTATLSAIMTLLEQVAKKVDKNEAAIRELKDHITRFETILQSQLEAKALLCHNCY